MGRILLERTPDGGAKKIIEGSELELSALLMLAISTDPEFRKLVTQVLDIYEEDQLDFDVLNRLHNPTNLN
jgi:hypothetical protein